MAVLKKFVRNRSRPEGCIAKGYGTEEVIEFYVDFIDYLNPIGVPMLRLEGRLKGKGILGKKSNMHIPESETAKQTSPFYKIHPSWLHIWMNT